MKEKQSILTDAALEASKFLQEVRDSLKDVAKQPFMKKEINRQQLERRLQWERSNRGG